MKKNYVVSIEEESWLNCGNGKFKHNRFIIRNRIYFENYEDAKNFVDNYNIEIKNDYHLDIGCLFLYSLNEEDNKIKILYDKTFSYDEINKVLGYEMKIIC